jgi:hypothetical protein
MDSGGEYLTCGVYERNSYHRGVRTFSSKNS